MNVDKLLSELEGFIPVESERNIAVFKASMFKPELLEALDYYLDTGSFSDFSVDKITLEMIVEKLNCNKIQAFFTMDELMRDKQYRKHFMSMSFRRK